MDVQAEPVKKPEDLAPITRKDGDERSSVFWNLFASGDRKRTVAKETAIFVAKTIVDEVLGEGAASRQLWRSRLSLGLYERQINAQFKSTYSLLERARANRLGMPVPPPVSLDLTLSKGHDANGI